jgi:hypothetical protein
MGWSTVDINELSDVTLTSPANGDFLKYNGSAWVNDPINLGSDTIGNYVSDVVSGTGISVTHAAGEGSSASVALNATLNDLVDVASASPSDGQFLKYISASAGWSPANIPTINFLDDIGDVNVAGVANNQFLKWSGTAWVPDTVTGGATLDANPPGSGQSGEIWFETDTSNLYVRYSNAWVPAKTDVTSANMDGGNATSVFGGFTVINGGTA